MILLELIHSLWDSCTHAMRGVLFVARSQRNFRIHLLATWVLLVAAAILHFSRLEWVLLILTIVLVILGELLNTALEFALNLVEARDHPVVRTAKDIAAGGVLLAVVGSVFIGIFLFGPRLWVFLKG